VRNIDMHFLSLEISLTTAMKIPYALLLRGGVLRVLLPLALLGATAGVTVGILMGLQGKKTAPPKKKGGSPPLPQRKK